MVVKLSGQGINGDTNISQFLGNSDNRFENVQFVFGPQQQDADIWFVADAIDESDASCDCSLTVFLSGETMWGPTFFLHSRAWRKYLSQFDHIYTNQALGWANSLFALPFLPWMINAFHGPSILTSHHRDRNFLAHVELPPKKKKLSVVCSSKTITKGHVLRNKFLEFLSEHLGDHLEWYGSGTRFVAEKWDAIAPFQFHLVLENQSSYGMVSEKLYDAFLGQSYPIYWGAPDVDRYFPRQSLTTLNLFDFQGSLNAIRECLESDVYQVSISQRLRARDLVLDKYNLFIRIARLAQNLSASPLSSRRVIKIRPVSEIRHRWESRLSRYAW